MKMYVLPFVLALGLLSNVAMGDIDNRQQDRNRFEEELNERDFDALRDYLKTKREVDLNDKSKEITISGDVRAEWRHLKEFLHDKSLRPRRDKIENQKGKIPTSDNDFDAEFNLRIDYDLERTWATAHVQFDNSGGVDGSGISCDKDRGGFHGSGSCDNLCLKKAFFGYEIYECGNTEFYVELGRRNLYNIFDSRIQFLSRFDGVYLHYESAYEDHCGRNVCDWYGSFGGFVVDERVNQGAWVAEIGFLNIYDSGIDFKYSVIDWRKRGKNRCGKQDPEGFKFINSQFTMAYRFEAEIIGSPATVYGAFLINHLGHRRHYYDRKEVKQLAKNQNTGWYLGFKLGEVAKEGDWSFEMCYEYVKAFAVPDEDASGICNGNVLNSSITQKGDKGAGGNTNYKGWRFETLYALTDNITIDTQLEWSASANENIGGKHYYSKFELEAIYAF